MTKQMSINILLPVVDNVVNSETVQTVDMRKVHEWLDVRSKYTTWIQSRIADYQFEENIDFISTSQKKKIDNFSNLHTTTKDYHATLEMAKEICMVERNDKGREARKYFIECEKAAKSRQPDISTHINAVKAYLGELERNEVLKLERDKAIKTKAEIGSKREATAMANASKVVKENNKLKIELDQSNQYATIKRMQIKTGKTFSWRSLKKAGVELGIKPKKVPDVNYGEVNSYHKDVWLKAYDLDIN